MASSGAAETAVARSRADVLRTVMTSSGAAESAVVRTRAVLDDSKHLHMFTAAVTHASSSKSLKEC